MFLQVSEQRLCTLLISAMRASCPFHPIRFCLFILMCSERVKELMHARNKGRNRERSVYKERKKKATKVEINKRTKGGTKAKSKIR